MKPQKILEHYFKGKAHLHVEYGNQHIDRLDKYGIENLIFWADVVDQLDSYTSGLSSEIIDMEREHYKSKLSFDDCYNVVAPTKIIMNTNRELSKIAKNIEQTERIRAI